MYNDLTHHPKLPGMRSGKIPVIPVPHDRMVISNAPITGMDKITPVETSVRIDAEKAKIRVAQLRAQGLLR